MIHEIKSKTPNQLAINLLAEALSRAEKGDIQNVVVFGSDGEGCTFRLAERDLIDLNCNIRKDVS